MKKRLIVIGILLIAGVTLSFPLSQRADAPVHADAVVTLTAPDGRTEEVAVEIADEESERAIGLMNRDVLDEGTGMLFTYASEQTLSFWMKNTRIPLDILFFDSEGAFVSRTTMDPCVTADCPVYRSAGPARYGLEVSRGEERTIEVGTGWTLAVEE